MIDPRMVTGYTMAQYHVGVSLVTALPVENVIGRQIESYTGGTLFILGQSGLAGIALVQASATHDIPGGAPFFISARGATATANVISYLSNPSAGVTMITG